MLKTAGSIQGMPIHASDGVIGKVEDLYFDDEAWAIRYLVIDTGDWLPGRKVLISPASVRNAEWKTEQLHVALTKEQIEKSPPIDTHKPVSRQREAEYLGYYGYTRYWGGPSLWGAALFPGDLAPILAPVAVPVPEA